MTIEDEAQKSEPDVSDTEEILDPSGSATGDVRYGAAYAVRGHKIIPLFPINPENEPNTEEVFPEKVD
jgi:hypothetical protein